MSRKPLIISSTAPYHVCARSNNQEWFNVPLPEMWTIFSECLQSTQSLFSTEYYAFVLMSNHFHLLLRTANADLGASMRYLMTEVSRKTARASGRINKIFGARYKWSILHDAFGYAYVFKYVLRNPVRAGICKRIEDYPFSTFSHSLEGKCYIPLSSRCDGVSSHIPKDIPFLLEWLNRPTPKEVEALIGLGLRRFEFQFTKSNDQQHNLRALRASYGVEEGR